MRLAIAKLPSEFRRRGLASWVSRQREPEPPPRMQPVTPSTTTWSTNNALPESYPTFTVTSIPVIVPCVAPVVRPYVYTGSPANADTVSACGVPYPGRWSSRTKVCGGGQCDCRVNLVTAFTPLFRHLPKLLHLIGLKSASVPMASSGLVPPS